MRLYFSRILSGDERSVTVKRNIIASFFIKGVSIIISLMLVPLTLGYVSSELYGIWLTLSSIIIWLNFFDIGFTLGLKNKLAVAIANGDWSLGRSLVSTTYAIMIVIFVPLGILLELIVPHINWTVLLNIDPHYQVEITNTLYILVACFCLQMIVNVLSSVVAAFQQVALSSSFPVIGNLLSLIAIFYLTKFCPPSLPALAMAISIMPIIVVGVASVILFHGRFKRVSPSLDSIDMGQIKTIFTLGVRFFCLQLQAVILFQTTNVLISNVSAPTDVTAYNIAYKYLNIAMMAYAIILAPLWPAFTEAYARKDYYWMRKTYRKMEKIYLWSAVIMVLMIASSPIVYHLWIGMKAEIPFTMTLFVGVYMLLSTWGALQAQLLNGIGSIKLEMYVAWIGAVIHIPMSLFLGQYIEALGVIFSLIIIVSVSSIIQTIQLRKILECNAKGIWIA